MRSCRLVQPPHVSTGHWSKPHAARARQLAPGVSPRTESRPDRRCKKHDCCSRSCFSPRSSGRCRCCESRPHSLALPRCCKQTRGRATPRLRNRSPRIRSRSPRRRSNRHVGPSSPGGTCSGHGPNPTSGASTERPHREQPPTCPEPSSSPRRPRPSNRESTSGWALGSRAVHTPAAWAERIRR